MAAFILLDSSLASKEELLEQASIENSVDSLSSADKPVKNEDQPMEPLTLKGRESVSTFKISLSMLADLVEEKNLDLAIGETQIDQAKGYFNQSIAAILPSIRIYNYVERYKGADIFIGANPFAVDRTTYQGKLSADYTVQLGGKSFFQIKAMRSQLKRIQASQEKTHQKALLEAFIQYFTLLRDNGLVAVSQKALEEAEAEVQYNESRFRSGFGTKLDIMQAKALRAERKSEVLKAENQREVSSITLGAMLDLPLSYRIELVESKLEPITFIDEGLTLSRLYELAMENRPDIKELSHEINEAKARYAIARADLFPTLSLSGYKRGVGPELAEMQGSNQLFASVSIDVLRNMGWDTLSMMQVQRAKIKETILNKEKQLNEIQKALAKAYEENSLYRESIKVAKEKLNATSEAYRIAKARHKSGVGIGLEVVQAEKDLTDAEMDYHMAVAGYNNAQLKLLYESGQLIPKNIVNSIEAISSDNSGNDGG